RFRAANRFYGGQVGGRVNWVFRHLDFELAARVAVGMTQQLLSVGGATSGQTPGLPPTVMAGGALSPASNNGHSVRNEFGVVPEVGLNVSYHVTPRLQAQVGYTFLYWSSAAQAGQQIDQAGNLASLPLGPIVSAPGDFWAQGLNLGFHLLF